MCQILNIWHISHTKSNLSPFSRCEIWYIFCNIEQYCDKFATVRNACDTIFILCLFLSLSSLRRSHLSHPNPLLSLSPQSSLLFHTHTHAHVDDHFHADTNANLSLAMVFLFFFFFWLWFDGFGFDGGGWVRMG